MVTSDFWLKLARLPSPRSLEGRYSISENWRKSEAHFVFLKQDGNVQGSALCRVLAGIFHRPLKLDREQHRLNALGDAVLARQ